tara:strand:+ start:710 stop:1120 length:411 start_codon:yes stop_codon:yes gene_type:complete
LIGEWDEFDSDEVSQVFVLDGLGNLLILKRSSEMEWAPDQWALPGGHIRYDETPEEGAYRETFEETNLDVKGHIEFYKSEDSLHYFVSHGFEGLVELNFEHTDFAWVNSDNLNDYDIFPNVKKEIETLFSLEDMNE